MRKRDTSRFYDRQGNAVYEVPRKRGPGSKQPTIVDAREMGLLPSVTTITKCIDKPDLNVWREKQAAMAILRTPRLPGEKDEEFINRVLVEEAVQEEFAKAAAIRGTAIHDAIASAVANEEYDKELTVYVTPVLSTLKAMGKVVWAEKVLVGDGYAGRADILVDSGRELFLTDFKTTGKLPKNDSYMEHKLQTSAYAKAIGNTGDKKVLTANIYISTSEPGQIKLFMQDNWQDTYAKGFRRLLKYWQWANDYYP